MSDPRKLAREFDRFQRRKEAQWVPAIYKAIRKQVNDFIATYRERPQAVVIVNAAPLHDVLSRLYIDTGRSWGIRTHEEIRKEIGQKGRPPIGLSEFLRAAMLNYFEIDLLNDVQRIDETTRENILQALRISTEQAMSLEQTIQLINDTAIPRWRARLIARTETVTAANQGAALAASQTSIKLNKTWISVDDMRTRPHHREMNGVEIPENESFIVAGFPMQQPGDRGQQGQRTPAKEICNCRCVVGYRGQRDANGRLVRR